MGGLEKTAPDGTSPHLHGHGNSMTESAQWGQFSENTEFSLVYVQKMYLS